MVSHEAGVVGAMLAWQPAIDRVLATGLTSGMFSDPTAARVFSTVVRIHGRGERVSDDLIANQAGVDQTDVSHLWNAAYGETGAVQAARQMVESRVALRLSEELHSVLDAAASGAPVETLLAMVEQAAAVAAPSVKVTSRGLEDALHAEHPYDWVIPGLLERGNRLLITAVEGGGKTELLIQLGVQAAAGIHPWTLKPVPPVRVLYVDLELGERDIARRLRRIAAKAPGMDRKLMRWVCRPEGMNLLAGDGAWLMSQLSEHPADLLIMGPLYAAYAGVAERGDVGGEDMARRMVGILNRLKERHGLAMVLETHAPHAQSGTQRDLRPFGSSVWLRWPDFGIGLRKSKDPDHPNRFTLEHWRGPRDVRQWPTSLDRGGFWPWEAYSADGMFANNNEGGTS